MNTREFIEKMDTDNELAKKFAGVNQAEKFYEIAKENGLTDDFETMKAVALEMYKEQSENGEIDINVLNEISAGYETKDVVISATVSAAIVGINVVSALA